MTDTIMIGWPRKTGLIERFIETKTASIISRTSKAVYICHFEHSLVGHKKIVLVIPPLGELEPGFEIWLPKINTLAKELSTNIFCYCNQTTQMAVQEYFRHRKHKCGFSFSDEYNLPDMHLLQKYVTSEDMLIYVAARRSSVSYDNCMEDIQERLDRQFQKNSKIIIYPRTHHIDSKFSEYSDINSETLNQGFERVQKIGRELGNLLKRDHHKS